MSDHILDATKMIQDTPRMEAALIDAPDAGFANIWKVGCEIERELNESNQIIRQQQLLDEENLRLQERIKRLEEAGDAMVSHAKALGMDGTGLVKRWSKAKEAKP